VHYFDRKRDEPDNEAATLMEELKRKVKSKLFKANYKSNEVDWVGITGVSVEAYDTYISSFVRDFYTGVIRLIEKAVKLIDTSNRFIIADEIHKHMDICKTEEDNFMGRDQELFKVCLCLGGFVYVRGNSVI
jgi:hypothetical protein